MLLVFAFLSKMPNQMKVVVSVRSARCSTKSIITFGILFLFAAAFHFGFEFTKLHSFIVIGDVVKWHYLWLIGYSTLIGVWSHVVGAVGVCASKPGRSKNKCLIATFGFFCLILIGTISYAINDYRPRLSTWIKNIKDGRCNNSSLYTNCYFNLSLYGCYIFFAAVILLHSVWCVICCLGSFILATDVQPGEQDGEQQVPQPTTPQDMLMEDRPPMYNPAMQVSTDNLQGNAPMPYGNGPPIDPTMQGNMQMQGNAPMPLPSAPPIYPTMQGSQGSIQGNAI